MANRKDVAPKIIRTSVMLPESTDAELRAIAAANDRPLSREVRRAIERYIEVERGRTRHPAEDPDSAEQAVA